MPTPTRNLLNEFKEAVKEIEKQVVKADNQPNLANQANSGNIDSLTKQISYLQNALQNSTKDAPTPSTATKEADSLSQATPNLVSDGVVSETDARNLAKNISLNKDIAIELQPKADLLKLVKDFSNVIKTPIFESKISIDKLLNHLADKTDADKRLEYLNLIKPTLENPLFITRENNRYRFVKTFIDSDKITKFLSVIENDKGEFIGITATPIKNTDLKNLLKGNIVWGGDTLSTLSTPQIAKREVEAISETIPNQTIKQAETIAKTAEPQTTKAKEPMATTAKPQEPTPQATKEADKKAKLDEELAKNKAYVEGLERDAISKIEALHNFNKTKVKAEVTISSKSIISQAEQELKEFAKSIGNSQEQIDKFSLKGIQHLRSYLNDLGSYFYRTKNQRAQDIADKYNKMLDDMAKIRATKKDIKSQKDEQRVTLVNEAIESFRKLWFSDLKSYSNFLIKYGKTDEFMTKANPKWKSEFDEVRASMERKQNIEPIKEFGTNYAEFYRDGQNAIKKLLVERQGQVAGAFHKDGRDITISWGEAKMANG
ncbi:PBECR2 nuclease fold domain-containing protein, partial [Campylobacter lanienae]|uniref:PBECR2 nuclease fold domain-containing protein n=2 Tax=Campylobacter lanienae TaxID=75658 RepID=UPI0023511B02